VEKCDQVQSSGEVRSSAVRWSSRKNAVGPCRNDRSDYLELHDPIKNCSWSPD